MLWIAVHLPRLPLEVFLCGSPTLEPFAVADGPFVLACDGKAQARGVRSRMKASAALALVPQLQIKPRDPAAETEALLGIAAWAAQFTPGVALDFPDALLLEVSGSLKLFGGLSQIAGDLREGCAAMGFTPLIACAPTARAATWLARAGRESVVTDSSQTEKALAALPVSVLRCEVETLEALAAIGVFTAGELLALPREGVARRFGQNLLDDLDRARARLPDPRNFFTLPARFSARLELPAEVTQTEALLFAAKRLLVQLAGFLAARQGGVQRFVLKLSHGSAGTTEIAVGMVAPSRDAGHFTQLLREQLSNIVLRNPVRAIAVEAGDVLHLAGDNLGLFPDPAGAPGDWERLIERLRARLGVEAVHGIGVRAEHRPERAMQRIPSFLRSRNAPSAARASQAGAWGPGERPFWLLESPRPIEEVGAVPHYEGPLALLAGP